MQTLAEGFGLVESPRWHAERLWFADWAAGEIRALTDGGSDVQIAHRSFPLCFDFTPDGRLLVVSSETRSLLRLEDGGLVRHADLTPLSEVGANDIVVDGRANAYVNSPNAPFGTTTPPGERAPGRIALVTPDGTTRVVADDLDFPNGMAITPDNRTLVVAESYRCRLTAFDILDDGSLAHRSVFADLGQDPPDGITIDDTGAVWYADVPHGRCVRVARGGSILERIDLDRGAFACMLGGADGRTLFVVGARWPENGLPAGDTDWAGTVWSTRVDHPRAGWPGG